MLGIRDLVGRVATAAASPTAQHRLQTIAQDFPIVIVKQEGDIAQHKTRDKLECLIAVALADAAKCIL